MDEKEYRSHPAISRSELWKIKESPEKFKFYKDNPPEPTPALIFGQAFHKLVLEPDTFAEEIAVFPGKDRRTKAYADFKCLNEDKIIISAEEYRIAKEMCDSLYNHPDPEIRKIITTLLSGEREKTFFWTDEETGETCKCRVDCIIEKPEYLIVTDLKSALSADLEQFTKKAIEYGYDFQSAMYSEGVKKNTGKKVVFVFIAVEKEPPYAVNVFQVDELFLKRGYDIFRELIGVFHECKNTGDWYGYMGKFKMIHNLALPAWLAKEIE